MAIVLRTIGNTRTAGMLSIDGSGGFLSTAGGSLYGDLNMNGNNIFGLPLIPPTPDSATSKSYVDSLSAGLDPKESCRYITTGNIANFTVQATVEGALDLVGAVAPSLVNDDRVLVKNQADARENGIYWWQTASTSLVRAPDQDGTPGNEVSGGNYSITGTFEL